ncbi:hypothetical protein DITRI_Ditri07aG0113100 [Diplodiscus trichospermus]
MYNLDGKKNRCDYFSDGKTILPNVYLLLSLVYFTLPGIWIYVLYKRQLSISRIHFLMLTMSIKNLREASKTDEKAMVNLMKLTQFRHYYSVVICYIYFTRFLVIAMETFTCYKYIWISVVVGELVTLAFYVYTGCKFKPESHNLYFVTNDDEEVVATQLLMTED